MRPHLSLLIIVIALGASSAAIAASTSTTSGGGGGSTAAGGGAHGGGEGGGGHSGGVGGHAVSGGGFSNSGRFGSANLGRGSFTQALGNHTADHAIAVRTALRTPLGPELGKTHPGNPDHHHHRGWRGANTNIASTFRFCASRFYDPEGDFVFGSGLLCGSALKAPTNPRSGRPAG